MTQDGSPDDASVSSPGNHPPEPGRDGPTSWQLDPCLEAAGFNAIGVLGIRDYDALVPAAWGSHAILPQAQSAQVLACGGPAFGDAYMRSPEFRLGAEPNTLPNPIDRFSEQCVEQAAATLRERGFAARALFYWQRREDQFADFVALGRACGLGSDSRLGILLHPTFGPWLAIRAVILTQATLEPTAPLAGSGPCVGCSAPCSTACPGGALSQHPFDIDACRRTTLSLPACRQRCDARRSCVVGRAHAYRPETEQLFRSAVVRAFQRAAD